MLIDRMKTEITRFRWVVGTDFGVADTSHAVNIPVWGTDYVIGMYGRITTAFAGATTMTMKIGTTTSDDIIMKEQSLMVVGNLFPHLITGRLNCPASYMFEGKYDYAAPIITFTSTGVNLSSLTAGEVELVVMHLVPDK